MLINYLCGGTVSSASLMDRLRSTFLGFCLCVSTQAIGSFSKDSSFLPLRHVILTMVWRGTLTYGISSSLIGMKNARTQRRTAWWEITKRLSSSFIRQRRGSSRLEKNQNIMTILVEIKIGDGAAHTMETVVPWMVTLTTP